MKNMMGMMKQAQAMQKNMELLQKELEEVVMQGQSGAGMVTIDMTCKHDVRAVKINPSIVDADDVETLEDLVAVAIADAHRKIESHVTAEMKKITGGMNIPGLS